MAPWLRISALAIALAWPLALHLAALSDRSGWMPGITLLAGTSAIAIWIATKPSLVFVLAGLGAAGLLLTLALVAPSALVFGPPMVLDAALGAMFAGSLRRGREPAIAVFARLEQGTLTSELARYTRGLTWLWTVLFFVLAVGAFLLAVYGTLSAWSWFVNCATYVAFAGLFIGEYLYRRFRFPNYRHASLTTLFRNVRAHLSPPFVARHK